MSEARCAATLDWGDSWFACQLAPGHDGPHEDRPVFEYPERHRETGIVVRWEDNPAYEPPPVRPPGPPPPGGPLFSRRALRALSERTIRIR